MLKLTLLRPYNDSLLFVLPSREQDTRKRNGPRSRPQQDSIPELDEANEAEFPTQTANARRKRPSPRKSP